jgi:putative peptidoglycan lipid II flippase
VLIAMLSTPIVHALGGKLDPASTRLARAVFLWLIPASAACILAAVLRAYWYAHRDFLLPGISQLFVPLSTCAGAGLVALGFWDLRRAAAIANVGAFALLFVLLRPLWRTVLAASAEVFSPRALWQFGGRFGVSLLQVTASLTMLPAMVAAARIFASSLLSGSVTAVSLAASVASIPGQFAAASLGIVLLPQTALWKAAGRTADAAYVVERALCNTAFVAIPCALVLALWSREVVDIVFQRGAFDRAAVSMTASALAGFSLGIPAQAGIQVLTFALFAMLGTRQVAMVAVATFSLNLLLSRALLSNGVLGIAGAFSFACLVNSAALLWLLARALPEFQLRRLLLRHLRILAISVVAGIAASVVALYVKAETGSAALAFAITLAFAAAIYLGGHLLLATPEMAEILDTLRLRFRRRPTAEVLSAGD